MAQVLVLQRRDGTTEIAHIGSPYLAVIFERVFKREASTATDNAWIAFFDAHDRAPEADEELLEWLKQFVATDIEELHSPNGSVKPPVSSPT